MKRLFLNQSKPSLHQTVDFLLKNHLKDRKLDLRNVIIALPGKRAIYRLQELLAEKVETETAAGKMVPDWYPPMFFTLGTLPELLYEKKKPFAGKFTQELAWVKAAEQLTEQLTESDNADLVRKIIPAGLPEELDAKSALGKMFADIHSELAADCLDCNNVENHCRKHNLADEAERWKALAAIQSRYLKILDDAGVWDLQTARLFFIEPPAEFKQQVELEKKQKIQQFQQEKKQIYLAGLTDMNRGQKAILKLYREFITVLIFASEEQKNKFDEFGCLIPKEWQYPATEIGIDDSQIKFVSGYEEQADAVLRKIASFDGKYSPQEIVVCIPDKDAVPALQQYLEKHGIKNRSAEGTPVKQTPVFRFLNSLYKFSSSFMFSDFAEIVRHIDVQQYIEKQLEEKQLTEKTDILTLLDTYYSEHLPLELMSDGTFIHSQKENGKCVDCCVACRLKPVWEALIGLTSSINELKQNKPLMEWAAEITEILEKIYGKLPENRDNTSDTQRLINRVRTSIRDIFRSFDEIPASLVPKTDAAGALRYLLRLLQYESVPQREEDRAIELLGWLETVMLDVPVIITTGMNDGKVPSFLTSDVFLPDSMRHKLELNDNIRRYARDAYNLQTVLQSGRSPENVLLISGRKSDKGTLLPSRLFFATDNKTATERVRKFFDEIESPCPSTEGNNTDNCPSETNNSHTVKEQRWSKPKFTKAIKTDSISVTDFKSYIASPYRYFLERQLGLQVLNDSKEEMDNLEFGTLIHGVLEKFGSSNLKDSTDTETVFDFLENELEKQVQEKYGANPRAVVAVQKKRALERLKVFAEKQTVQTQLGWRLIASEFNADDIELKLEDGRTVRIKGRIDRIDYSENEKKYRLLDYKTGSKKNNEPNSAYSAKKDEWKDLQLPLYDYILRHLPRDGKNIAGLTPESKIEVGYFLLPASKDETGVYIADWGKAELDRAVVKAREIAAAILDGNFTDPDDIKPPFWDTPFDWITMKGLV